MSKPTQKILPAPKNDPSQKLKQDLQSAFRNESFGQAQDLATQVFNLDPESAESALTLASAMEKAGKTQDAFQLIANHPASQLSTQNLIYAGQLAINLQLAPQAIQFFQKALTINPELDVPRQQLIRIFRALGQHPQAYIQFLEIQKQRELNKDEKLHFMQAINNIVFHNNHLELLKEFNALLDDDQLDKRFLANKMCEIIVQAFPDLKTPNDKDLSHPFLSNPDCLALLKKFPFSQPDLDLFLKTTRRNLLLKIAEAGEIADELIPLCIAIAVQNHLNEYVQDIAADEQQILQELRKLVNVQIQQTGWEPAFSEAIIIILLMYESLIDIETQINELGDLKEFSWPLNLDVWPVRIAALFKSQVIDRLEEIKLAQTIPSLTRISELTPDAVRALYEENPYPRWTDCSTQSFDSLGHYLKLNYPQLTLSREFFNTHPKILIAGCGTGKHAIEVAYLYPKAEITAIDISRRSLAYAQRMATKLNIQNVKFFHADILELTPDIGRFDMIESCGVLHHLVDPMAGWKKLVDLLNPKGIMRIALYSRSARNEINQRRAQIEQLNIAPTLNNMRLFRSAVIAQHSDQFLLNFRDLYVTSELRDLLFHPQETQYSLEEINDCLKQLSLNYITLQVEPALRAQFRKEMPSQDEVDWRNWSAYEEKNPYIFSAMYCFWCQKQ